MNRIVLDANVLVKLFFEEEHSDVAIRLVRSDSVLLAPDFFWAEVVHVVWKYLRRRKISDAGASNVIGDMLRVSVTTHSCFGLAATAFDVAVRTGCTVYDGMYVALAMRENVPLVTDDQRLVSALAGGPYARYVVSLSQVEE